MRTRLATAIIASTLSSVAPLSVVAQDVSFPSADGETLHATWFRARTPGATVILAFHQGGASGAAEYGPIAPRLNAEGYDVLAVDLRAGGTRFDGVNRTVAARGESSGFCEAAPDLAGALRYVRAQHPDRRVILWGSSFSGALVLRLAAERPAGLAGVLAFSPASGGPMASCRGEDVSERITVPVLALRPRSEMDLESSRAQFERFQAQRHETYVADPGVHGSSMLVAERVGASVDPNWDVVLRFLRKAGQ